MSSPTPAPAAVTRVHEANLELELEQAAADIDAGRCFTLTPEMAAEWAATGTCAGLDEWLSALET